MNLPALAGYFLTAASSALLGVAAMKGRSMVSIGESRERVRLQETEAPIEFLKKALAAKDLELSSVRGIINSRLEKDGIEREHLAQVLTESMVALKTIVDEQQKHATEERIRASAFHAKLEDMHRDIVARNGQRGTA